MAPSFCRAFAAIRPAARDELAMAGIFRRMRSAEAIAVRPNAAASANEPAEPLR